MLPGLVEIVVIAFLVAITVGPMLMAIALFTTLGLAWHRLSDSSQT